MKRRDYLLKAAVEMGIPPMLAGEPVASTILAHPPGWGDDEVDPETGETMATEEE